MPIRVKMAKIRNKESKTCIQKLHSFLFCCLLIPFRYLQCMLFLSILLSIANTYSFCKFNAHRLLCQKYLFKEEGLFLSKMPIQKLFVQASNLSNMRKLQKFCNSNTYVTRFYLDLFFSQTFLKKCISQVLTLTQVERCSPDKGL